MITQKYPSREFPALPEIEIQSLDMWKKVDLPESVLSIIKEKGETEFSPNIIISSYKVAENFDFAYNKKNIGDSIAGFFELHIFNDIIKQVNNRDWQIIEYIYDHEQAGTIAQIVATTIVDIESSKFVVRFTGTAAAKKESENKDYKEIQQVLSTIKVDKGELR